MMTTLDRIVKAIVDSKVCSEGRPTPRELADLIYSEIASSVHGDIIDMAIRTSRDNSLTAAIEVCQVLADESGHNAACCVKALKDFRDTISSMRPPADANKSLN